MEALKPLENKLAEVFKNAPAMPENGKKSLVEWWPWIAVVFGLLQLWAAYALWDLTRVVNAWSDYANQFSRALTGQNIGPSSFQKGVMYLGLAVLVADAVILLMAYPKLKLRQKAGWDLLFMGAVLNTAFSILNFFMYSRGASNFITSVVSSAIAFWLLFQVRDKYTAAGQPAAPKTDAK